MIERFNQKSNPLGVTLDCDTYCDVRVFNLQSTIVIRGTLEDMPQVNSPLERLAAMMEMFARLDYSAVLFELGDLVRFRDPSSQWNNGVIEKLNMKRAVVRCENHSWNVAYPLLEHLSTQTHDSRKDRPERLKQVAILAWQLIDEHGLKEWKFSFNHSKTKLGQCRYSQKVIVLDRLHAATGSSELTKDTILHEIAHAIAGPEAGHGPKWKTIAQAIGAAPRSRAPESVELQSQRLAAKSQFTRGDQVWFEIRGERHDGEIIRLNPKRAKIRCGNLIWGVSYTVLKKVTSS